MREYIPEFRDHYVTVKSKLIEYKYDCKCDFLCAKIMMTKLIARFGDILVSRREAA